jgi:hypothetical protein
MKLAYTIRKPGARRALKAALALSLILVTALGAFAAKLLFEDHPVNADVTLTLCRKNANGGWDTIDRAQGTLNNLTATTTGDASGSFNTNPPWKFRSEKGRQVSVSQQGAGHFRLDKPNGWLTLDLPFTAQVDGSRLNQRIKLTNESIETPLGQKGGQKGEIEGRTSSASLFGITSIKERDLAPPRVTGVVGGSGGLNNELVLVVEIRCKTSW